jgi:formamidopyrimidine-DNA glycosylase
MARPAALVSAPETRYGHAMPELPEVETVRAGLRPALEGQLLSAVEVRRGDLRQPVPADFAARLVGRRIARLGRRGKYLLAYCENDPVLIIHLGMSGRLTIIGGSKAQKPGRFTHNGPPLGAHDHIEFITGAGTRIVYSDHRRFGLMTLATADGLESHPLLKGMGPEPLNPGFTARALAERLNGKTASIRAALLDQRVVAGLGNIYVAESLFRAGISPSRKAGAIGPARVARLVDTIKTVLEEAIAAGGSTLRDYAQTDGELGYFQHRFQVYGRAGAPCVAPGCGGQIQRRVEGGRSSFHCPRCQR